VPGVRSCELAEASEGERQSRRWQIQIVKKYPGGSRRGVRMAAFDPQPTPDNPEPASVVSLLGRTTRSILARLPYVGVSAGTPCHPEHVHCTPFRRAYVGTPRAGLTNEFRSIFNGE